MALRIRQRRARLWKFGATLPLTTRYSGHRRRLASRVVRRAVVSRMRTLLASLLAAATATPLHAQPSITDTRLIAQPALSSTNVAFIYAGDLWISRTDGTDV